MSLRSSNRQFACIELQYKSTRFQQFEWNLEVTTNTWQTWFNQTKTMKHVIHVLYLEAPKPFTPPIFSPQRTHKKGAWMTCQNLNDDYTIPLDFGFENYAFGITFKSRTKRGKNYPAVKLNFFLLCLWSFFLWNCLLYHGQTNAVHSISEGSAESRISVM